MKKTLLDLKIKVAKKKIKETKGWTKVYWLQTLDYLKSEKKCRRLAK